MIYIFLLENKPFTKENIKSYKNKAKSKKSDKNVQIDQETESSGNNLIMSPSKNSNFSPYRAFLRAKGRRSTVVNKNVDITKILHTKNESTKKNSKDEKTFTRKGRKRRTVQYESNIINLKDIQEEEARRKINEERIKDLTRKKKQANDLPEAQSPIPNPQSPIPNPHKNEFIV